MPAFFSRGTGAVSVYRLTADNVIDHVDSDWIAFARQNGAAGLVDRVLGTPVWDYLDGSEVIHVYEALFAQARQRGRSIKVPFRCDSPDLRRYMELEIVPLGSGQLELRTTLLSEERRTPIAILDPHSPRSADIILMCAWCKRLKTNGWKELEDAVRELGLFNQTTMPSISHGICDRCLSAIVRARKDRYDSPS